VNVEEVEKQVLPSERP